MNIHEQIERAREMLRGWNNGEFALLPPHMTAIYDLLKACDNRIKELESQNEKQIP